MINDVYVLLHIVIQATPSNCGEFLKLYLPSSRGQLYCGQVNDLGYGKNGRDDER